MLFIAINVFNTLVFLFLFSHKEENNMVNLINGEQKSFCWNTERDFLILN